MMDILKDIVLCEQDKVPHSLKSHLSLKNQFTFELVFPSVPHPNAVSSFPGTPLCLISDAFYRTPPSCDHFLLSLPHWLGNSLSKEVIFTWSLLKCHLVLGRCSVNAPGHLIAWLCLYNLMLLRFSFFVSLSSHSPMGRGMPNPNCVEDQQA